MASCTRRQLKVGKVSEHPSHQRPFQTSLTATTVVSIKCIELLEWNACHVLARLHVIRRDSA